MATPEIRDALDHLQGYRTKADGAEYCGFRVVDLTRDELIALAAMLVERELRRLKELGLTYSV